MSKGTALITGASSGIGAELARLCAADGYDLIVVSRNPSHSKSARALAEDLADPAAPRRIFDATSHTPIDILINNAGFGLRGAFAETDWEAEVRMLQVNVLALAHLTKLYLPAMLRRGSGRILNVASTAAFVPGPFMATYYASKAFVLSFSESVANEVQGTGVTVTALCPGPTRTEFDRTAGVSNTNLFRDHVMSAADVAREGYEAMMAGRMEVVAGRRNRWMMRGRAPGPAQYDGECDAQTEFLVGQPFVAVPWALRANKGDENPTRP